MTTPSKIIARVSGITSGDGMAEGEAQYIIEYFCTGLNGSGFVGSALLISDATQNDTQITLDLRGKLAAIVDQLVTPTQGYAANDVRGLNV